MRVADFQINSIPTEYIENGQWIKTGLATRLNGLPVWGAFVPHQLISSVMPMADWQAFKVFEGQQVIVRTVDYFSRNQFADYSGILKSMTGTQRSINMLNINISLLLFLGTNPVP